MKIPSLNYLVTETRRSFLRFPLVLLSAALGTACILFLIEKNIDELKDLPRVWKLIFTSALGVTLFFSIRVYCEKTNADLKLSIRLNGAGLLLLTVYFFTLPTEFSFNNSFIPYFRYAIYNLCLHLLVAFAPFIGKGEINGFWQYNKSLFIRFLLSALYSHVLYAGLTIAILAVKELFNVEVSGEIYGELYVFITGIFNTWFFLSGIPENIAALESEQSYPKGLRIFSQYVLMPLIVLYLLILYAYTLKILILWDWPKGIVSNLILGMTVPGILTLLLLYPYGYYAEQKWVRFFSTAYYLLLLPLTVVLYIAIGMRLSDYGITESRYYVLLLALWLTCMAVYFVFARTKNIKIIPISLCIFLFLSSFGPWGAFSASESSQVNRLENTLVSAGLLKEGKIVKTTTAVNDSLENEISSILSYLEDRHGYQSIQPWFSENLDSLFNPEIDTSNTFMSKPAAIMNLMGLASVDVEPADNNSYSFSTAYNPLVEPHHYQFLVSINEYYYGEAHRSQEFFINDTPYLLNVSANEMQLILSRNHRTVLNIPLTDFCKKLTEEYPENNNDSIPSARMTLRKIQEHVTAEVQVTDITITREGSYFKLDRLSAHVLFSFIADSTAKK